MAIAGRCAVWLLAVLIMGMASAGHAEQSQRVPVDPGTTQQKAQYIKRLVTSSVAVQRIETSDDAKAKASLAQARRLVQEAEADIKAGGVQAANDKLDEALRLVNTEARRLSGGGAKQVRMTATYERRLHSVQTFLNAYKRVAGERQVSAAAAAEMAQIEALIAEAEGHAKAGRLDQASAILDRAYRTARGDIRDMRQGKTLVRSLNFETAQEEYRYEHDRNESHIMLLKFAITEKNPPKQAAAPIERLRRQAVELRASAERQAEKGDYAEAIRALDKSTTTLLQAIRMAGIYVPG